MTTSKNNNYAILFLLMVRCSTWMLVCMAHNDTIPVKVGVVLDLETLQAKIWLSCIELALSDFYASHAHFKTRLVLNIRDSNKDIVSAASAALDLIKNVQVEAIIGPQRSTQAKFIIDLGQKAQVPIISFSATSPSLKTPSQSSYFFQTAISDSSQVTAISSIVKAFGWRKVVPIYVTNEYGEGIIPYLVDALEKVDCGVPYRSPIPPSATDDQIKAELYKLNTMQTRVFDVHMSYDLGSRLLIIAKKIGMFGQGYVWIITQGMTNLLGSLDSSIISSMEGVLGIKNFVPQSKELDKFKVRWKAKFYKDNKNNPTFLDAKINVIGLWAYDSAQALALAVENISRSSAINTTILNNGGSTTDLDSFGVSPIGPKLLETLSGTRFKGIAGNFNLDNGQLEMSAFQIVNGGRGREIGFWTQKNGLVRFLDSNNELCSTSKSNLGPIIWPGESLLPPRGWEIPTNGGKRLRIGIPVKTMFTEFVKVTHHDPSTNISEATGFSIDVFKAALEVLPYALSYDFFAYAKPDDTSAGTYDELVRQVYLENYDAVVADTTIRAKRTQYVDFTLPYTESGVAMVVPMKDHKTKSAWIFLKPLTWDLWVTILCFFLFIGFVVWVLEHRINEDFRGPPSHQIGTSFWFSFSTMVFAHKERVVSNLARFVTIIWVFVVLVLTQSYTASLTSLLTVEQLQPTSTDLIQLLKSGKPVGCQQSSFVYELLRQTGFPACKIVSIENAEHGDQLLSTGSAKGGIAAYVDETPYIRLFLATYYCSKYTMIILLFKTAGFGFAFAKGSPLVHDVSRAILNVTEGEEMKRLESKWLERNSKENTCLEIDPKISSNRLSLDSFWGLFLIAGISSLFALTVFAIMFLHKHWKILLNSNDSIRRKMRVIFKSFDQKDLSSHTFRKSNNNNTNCPPSPTSTTFSGSNSPLSMASPEVVRPSSNENIIQINEQ
ncbi:glutamate receptor 2.8-like [Humulus lupulus]|uniref:glutamate receptor 2.8-like n=1 Tax=Humulus lupulus TaxID=3486 RepID=UPI002B4016DC|nr:glutamate receptor 2.8-like [Humulus lupulus]